MPNSKHITVDQVIEVLADLQTKADGRFRAIATAIFEADLDGSLVAKINGKASQSDLQSLEDIVSDLAGEDGGKSARVIASEEVAKVVAGADASYDTLKELADWILNDSTGAAKMANDISALKTKTTLGTHEVGGQQVEYTTVREYVEAYVQEISSGIYTPGNGINIDANNVVSVKGVPGNGLNIDSTSGVTMSLATVSSNGAMAAADKAKIESMEDASASDIVAIKATIWPETVNG